MNIRERQKEILRLSKKEKEVALKDSSLRDELFKDSGHYPFIWLIQGLENEEILFLLDDELIPLLEKDSRKQDKLNAIMTSGNKYINTFLQKEKIIKLIVEHYNHLCYFIPYLDINFARSLFSYIINNNLDFKYLGYLKDDIQLIIIKENLDIIKERKVNIKFLFYLGKKTIEYLLNNDLYFENILVNADIAIIDMIVNKGIVLPISIQRNKTVINNYLQVFNINTFYGYINNLNNNVYLKDSIINARRKNYTTAINSLDLSLEIFVEFLPIYEGKNRFASFSLNEKLATLSNKKDVLLFLKKLTITRMLEMTIDTFYQDLTYNFLKNVEIMLSFISQITENIIPKDRLEIYKKILNYYHLTTEERIALYNTLNNGHNHVEEFYNDFRRCRDYSYQMLKDSLIDPSSMTLVSEVEGIDCYKLNVEDFKMLVSVVTFPRKSFNYPDHIWFENIKKTASLSLISEENLTVFGDPYKSVILGFNRFDPQNIMHTYHKDVFTNNNGSKALQMIYTPDSLIDNTGSYNEILMNEKDSKFRPSYIVCYDEVKEGDIKASQLLGNIPLIVIDTSKYNFKRQGDLEIEKYRVSSEIPDTFDYSELRHR